MHNRQDIDSSTQQYVYNFKKTNMDFYTSKNQSKNKNTSLPIHYKIDCALQTQNPKILLMFDTILLHMVTHVLFDIMTMSWFTKIVQYNYF